MAEDITPSNDMPKVYTPSDVEKRLYAYWTEKGYFTPRIDHRKEPFVIIMPPPNVTGELHLGHALTAAIEDILTRWHRMLGDVALWLPGSDHAGIATQWVVEQQLHAEGTSRQEIGRERFVERVWEWVRRYGDTIDEQHKRLGASCDWTRKRFTLDEGPSRAVRTTFVNLYNDGLIYRGERIINWCPRCHTALSDLEVIHEEEKAALYYIRYPLAEGDGHITVATTRPETMLGDTAVAVSPNDERYRRLVGKLAILPIMNRTIPIVADEAIDPEFGTGALKVTPGHDPVDFDIGQRHGLETVNVIGSDGRMTEAAGRHAGEDRYECQKLVLEELRSEGLLERVEPYTHSVGHCQRCGTTVEPLISKQWFVKVAPLAERSIEAVKEGEIRVVPERFVRVYLNWMENLRDWCISRQLWWGHRLPVWYCDDCGEVTVSVEEPQECAHCRSKKLHQDPDVLDTWFSSGLWPHSTLGWPDDSDDLRYFYPTSVMETAYDILFFWVARMIMMGLYNTGKVPFHTVYLHGLIRDAEGVKMSKTRGNVLDPLQLIERYGTDALRFAILMGTSAGNDSRLTEGKLEASRNFANKLWNAARFVLANLAGASSGIEGWYSLPLLEHREDRWIVSRLNRTAQAVSQLLVECRFGEAQQALHNFVWDEFCDWYIEMAKIRLRRGDRSPLRVLAHVLERVLRLLHPFIPFVTEELWQNLLRRLPREGELPESVTIAPYPQGDESRFDGEAEEEMGLLTSTIRAIRNIRSQLRVEPACYIEAFVSCDPPVLFRSESETVRTLARVNLVRLDSTEAVPAHGVISLVVGRATVRLPLGGVVDLPAERERLSGELERCHSNVERLEHLLANPEFVSRAPEEVVEREGERLQAEREQQARLEEVIAQLGS
jgi:valyl-tRNA synthetase